MQTQTVWRINVLKRLLLTSAVLALGVSALPVAAVGHGPACTDTDSGAVPLTVDVSGQQAHGLVALPDKTPKGIVVFAHGYGHTAESWRAHLVRVAAQDRVIAIAMNYRGDIVSPPSEPGGLPSSRGWQVKEGAEDSIAAARRYESACPMAKTVVMYGVSMGGNTAGLAVAAAPTRADGLPLFDFWVQVEGASNLIETYQEARAVGLSGNAYAANATADIERQTGGTFEQVPEAYLERTVVARVPDIAASGVKGVILVHGVDDGLVPYNQSRELAAALQAARVPAQLHSVLTREPGTEPGTTGTGTFLGATGVYESPFAGHASEASQTHTVGMAGFRLLSQVLAEREVRCGEFVIDGSTGSSAAVTATC